MRLGEREQAAREAFEQASSARGSASASVKASGGAAGRQVAQVDGQRLVAEAIGATVERKCRPSTSMSLETASRMPGAGASSAQSSPMPSAARRTGRVKYSR